MLKGDTSKESEGIAPQSREILQTSEKFGEFALVFKLGNFTDLKAFFQASR